jgi:hypothetical protein
MLTLLCFLLMQRCFLKHPRQRINQKRTKESKESVSQHPAKELQDRSPLQGLLRGRSSNTC